MPKDSPDLNSGLPPRNRLPELALFLAQTKLFAELALPACEDLASLASVRDYPKGRSLFTEGDPLRSVMVLLSGSVKLKQLTADGNEVILWLRRSGNAVGIFGIPAHGVYTCSAQAVTPVRALLWSWDKLNHTPQSAQIYNNIGLIVSEQLVELETRFREIATAKVPRRVASAIIRLLKQIGTASSDGIEVTLSREELAQLTGTTLFSISRLMTQWSAIGIVQPHREGFIVRDADRLIQIGAQD